MEAAKKRILKAMLRGEKLTTLDANTIGRTTEGGRRIRELRSTYPIIREQVPGERYSWYYIEPEFLKEHRKTQKNIWDAFKEIFGCE